jgi:cytochrome c peroxidase
MRALVATGLLLMSAAAGAADFDATQTRRILGHGPWPPPQILDRTNRYSGNADAIRLGAMLFGESRLSGNGALSCQSCHRRTTAGANRKPAAKGCSYRIATHPAC